MKPEQLKLKTIDQYIAGFPPDVQEILQEFRQMIRQAVPDAQEAISYGMPTFVQNGKGIIAFAAWKNHIAIYTAPRGTAAFQKEIAPYKAAKSTLQFPLGKPMPYELIKQAVTFRIKEHFESTAKEKRK